MQMDCDLDDDVVPMPTLDGCTLSPELWDGVLEMVFLSRKFLHGCRILTLLWRNDGVRTLMARLKYAADGITWLDSADELNRRWHGSMQVEYVECYKCKRSLDIEGRPQPLPQFVVLVKGCGITQDAFSIYSVPNVTGVHTPHVAYWHDGRVCVTVRCPTESFSIDRATVAAVNMVLPYGYQVREDDQFILALGVMQPDDTFKVVDYPVTEDGDCILEFNVHDHIRVPRFRPFS